MAYDWRGFIFLILAILIFVAIVLLVAGGVRLVQRAVKGQKARNRRTAEERVEIARQLREESSNGS